MLGQGLTQIKGVPNEGIRDLDEVKVRILGRAPY